MSLSKRVGPVPEHINSQPIMRIEIEFGIPVYLSEEHDLGLARLVDHIVRQPWNQPAEGVHWPAGSGGKPCWSKADAAFLGKPASPGAPDTGEPSFDMSVYAIECCAREFVSEKERNSTIERRRRPMPIAPPPGYATWLDAAVDSFPNTNLSIPAHVTSAQAEHGARSDLSKLRARISYLEHEINDLQAKLANRGGGA